MNGGRVTKDHTITYINLDIPNQDVIQRVDTTLCHTKETRSRYNQRINDTHPALTYN